MTAKVMNWPGGQVIVVAIGLAIVGYGGYLAWRGWTGEKFKEHLDAEGKSGDSGRAYIMFGRVRLHREGHRDRARRRALPGTPALTHDPKKSGGLDQALHKVLEQPFGQVLLVLIGARHRLLRPVLLRPGTAPVPVTSRRDAGKPSVTTLVTTVHPTDCLTGGHGDEQL